MMQLSNKKCKKVLPNPCNPTHHCYRMPAASSFPKHPVMAIPRAKSLTPTPADADHSKTHIIYPLLRRQRGILLIGGASRGGKSTFAVQMARDIEDGQPVMDFPTYAASVAYVPLSHSADAIQEIAERVGARQMPIVKVRIDRSKDSTGSAFDAICTTARKQCPELEVLFVDGIYRLQRQGSIIDYNPVASLLEDIEESLGKHKLALVAVGRSAKPRENSHLRAIERFMGNQAWTERPPTFLSIDHRDPLTPSDHRRLITIETSVAPSGTQDWQFTKAGALIPCKDAALETRTPSDAQASFETLVAAHENGQEFTLRELIDMAHTLSIPDSSCRRYVSEMCEVGLLIHAGHGRYQLPFEQ